MTDTDPNDDANDDSATGQQSRNPAEAGEPADGAANADVSTTTPNGGGANRSTDGGTAESPATGEADTSQSGEESGGRSTGERLAWLVQIATLVILCLLALVATFRFYFAASRAIDVWIADDFVPVFQAMFNLLVLIASAYGVSVLVRRLG